MKKVLIIEDDENVRTLLLEVLAMEGLETCAVDNGTVGIRKAKELLPDLVISDIRMPGADGFEVIRELRQDPRTAAIPFIFLTGVQDNKDIRMGMGMGADDYITKPFKIDDLAASVHARLRKYESLTRKLDELRTSLTRAVPHELFTPLNAILGFSTVIEDSLEKGREIPPEELKESIRYIRQAGEKLLEVTQRFTLYANLVATAKNDPALRKLRGESVYLSQRDIRDALNPHADALGRIEDLAVTLEPAEIRISPRHFDRLMHELLENALKFSREGSPVHVKGVLNGDAYLLTVTDRGRGLTVEQADSIGPFMQFGRESGSNGGVGLGLALVKMISDVYDASMKLESEPGRGTRVEIRFRTV